MITIDPERDTAEVLAEYVPLFHERLVGTHRHRTRKCARWPPATACSTGASRIANYTYYLMDHTSFVYLLAPSGEIAAMFRYGTPPEDMATAIRQHMRGNARG